MLAQLACKIVDNHFEPQLSTRQVAAEQHPHPERPQESSHATQSSPNLNEGPCPNTTTPMVPDSPRCIHPVHPQPQTGGSDQGRLPELKVQTNHLQKPICRLPSIQDLLEPARMTSLGNSQPGRVVQSPMMPPSPYTPGCSIPNHLRPYETQTHPPSTMISPRLTPRATVFRSGRWLSYFANPIAEQLQLASGSSAPAEPRDFMDHLGLLQCPFCGISVLQLDHFTRHLQHPCRSLSVGHILGMPTA